MCSVCLLPQVLRRFTMDIGYPSDFKTYKKRVAWVTFVVYSAALALDACKFISDVSYFWH